MNIRIILVCNQKEATQIYMNAIGIVSDVKIDTVSSFGDLYTSLKEIPYHGVMIDLATSVSATIAEKELIRRIQNAFPIILLKWENNAGVIRTFSYGKTTENLTLEDFIYKTCGSTQARKFRSNQRKNINFNIILSRDNFFNAKNSVRTITINVSKGGCFIYSVEEWKLSSNVWFIINDLKNTIPIIGEVKQYYEWGKTMRIPGVGVAYKDIKRSQFEEICSLIE